MSTPDLTLHEAASLLGVHYMTAYRYVRLGLLPAAKVGGVWRVRQADLAAFTSEGAEVAAIPAGRRRAPWAERLEARLVAGDGRGAWGVVEAALGAGAELDEIYLDLIAPAMRSIGARWERGELDVAVEHRASGIIVRLLGRLGPRLARRGRTRGTVLLGTPAGERHSLPSALVADLLRGAGWEVSDLGADLPSTSFVSAAREAERLAAVGVSVTSALSLPAAGELIPELRAAVPEGVYLVVGGAAIADADHARALGADGWAPSARDLIAQLDERAVGRSA